MNNTEIVQALKVNLAKYGDLPADYQKVINAVGKPNCLFLLDNGSWTIPLNTKGVFSEDYRYRISPDYKEEQEVVEMEVAMAESCLKYKASDGCQWSLSYAINKPDFIGFKAGDRIWGRLYRRKDNGDTSICIYADQLDKYDVVDMTEAKVLFKGKDNE